MMLLGVVNLVVNSVKLVQLVLLIVIIVLVRGHFMMVCVLVYVLNHLLLEMDFVVLVILFVRVVRSRIITVRAVMSIHNILICTITAVSPHVRPSITNPHPIQNASYALPSISVALTA
jgi:hypothetical protein